MLCYHPGICPLGMMRDLTYNGCLWDEWGTWPSCEKTMGYISLLGCVRWSIFSKDSARLQLLCEALMSPHLEYFVQFQELCSKRWNYLDPVQKRGSAIRVLGLSYKSVLQELVLFRLITWRLEGIGWLSVNEFGINSQGGRMISYIKRQYGFTIKWAVTWKIDVWMEN